MRYVLLAALLVGCGGDPPTQEEMLQGAWLSEIGPGSYCAYAASFEGDRYSDGLVCVNEDGSQARLQAEYGAFTARNGVISTTAQQSTCPDVVVRNAVSFSITGDKLSFLTPSGARTYSRSPSSGSGPPEGKVVFGCFEKGAFAPMPLHSVQ